MNTESIQQKSAPVEQSELITKQVFDLFRHKYVLCSSPLTNKHAGLLPWIEYYRMLGVTFFVVYNHNYNNSFDETDRLVQPYVEKGILPQLYTTLF